MGSDYISSWSLLIFLLFIRSVEMCFIFLDQINVISMRPLAVIWCDCIIKFIRCFDNKIKHKKLDAILHFLLIEVNTNEWQHQNVYQPDCYLSHLMRWHFSSSESHSSNAHTQPSSRARSPIFDGAFRLFPYFMCTNSEDSGDTAPMRRLTWAFAGRLWKAP